MSAVRRRFRRLATLVPTARSTAGDRHRRLRFEALEDRQLLSGMTIIDNGAAGYSEAGTWTLYSSGGYGGQLSYAAANPPATDSTATWSFGGLSAGSYLVWANWVAHSNRATNAPYSIYDFAADPVIPVATATANQQVAPNDYYDNGASWELLGHVDITGATLNVVLSNLANGYVIADAVAVQPLIEPTPAATVAVVDNGDAGYTSTGTWTNSLSAGYGGDLAYAPAGSGCCTATWQFTGLTPGQIYNLSATWIAHPNRTSAAPYTLYDVVAGSDVLRATVPVNQQLAPNDFYYDASDPPRNSWWENLGSVTPTETSLKVKLNNVPNGFVIADAVQLRSVAPPTPQDIAVLFNGTTNVPDGGTVAVGSTPLGTPLTASFTVRNDGGSTLTLFPPINVTAVLPVSASASGFTSTSLLPHASTIFTVTASATPAGTYSAGVSFNNDDPDENPFNFTMSFTVSPVVAAPIIIDNGDPGYSSARAWHDWAYGGYGGDVQWAAKNSCCTATWSFTGLTAGTYQVSATWVANTNRASNAPYRIYDGLVGPGDLLATVRVDQRTAPSGFSEGGVMWDNLGAGFYTITADTLSVTLADDADAYVIADAIRIERTSPLLAGTPIPGEPVGGPLPDAAGLDALRDAAVQRWTDAGLAPAEAALLRSVTITSTDLPDGMLGGATSVGILIDQDANGQGWFVDATPWEDGEFVQGRAPAGVDLLTVVLHELGHMLGRPDLSDPADANDLMALRLVSDQTRRLPGGPLVTGQNPLLPGDVDGNGVIAPLDVLLLLNQINGGGGPLTPVQAGVPVRYFDVTGDQRLTAGDVLDVINSLNARPEGQVLAAGPPLAAFQTSTAARVLAPVAVAIPAATPGPAGQDERMSTDGFSTGLGDAADLLDLSASPPPPTES